MGKTKLTDYQRDRLNYYRMLKKTYNSLCVALGHLDLAESLGSCVESDYGRNCESDGLYGMKSQLEDDLEGMKKSLNREAKVMKRLGLSKLAQS